MSLYKSILKTVKVSFGNVIEWYDYSLYGYFAIVISEQFFPNQDSWIALLLTFSTFAAGYVARPLGSVFFGYLGDKKGRHFAMNIAILLMAIPTMLMSIIPTYDTIGLWAPIILVIIRIFQGISAGGQFGNLMTIASESSRTRLAGLNVSIAFSTSILGFTLASGVSSLCVTVLPESLGDFIWRIPFGFGAILLISYLLMREKQPEKSAIASHRSPTLQLKDTYGRHVTIMTILATTTLMIYYIDITYMATYMVDILDMSLADALTINTIAIFFMFLVTPVFGYLSDQIGRRKMLIASYSACLVIMPTLVFALNGDNPTTTLVVLTLLAILTGAIQGAANPCYTEIFPRQVRASGASIVYGFGASLSGFAPLIATFITGVMSPVFGVAIFMFVLSALGLISIFLMPIKQIKTRRLQDIQFEKAKKYDLC